MHPDRALYVEKSLIGFDFFEITSTYPTYLVFRRAENVDLTIDEDSLTTTGFTPEELFNVIQLNGNDNRARISPLFPGIQCHVEVAVYTLRESCLDIIQSSNKKIDSQTFSRYPTSNRENLLMPNNYKCIFFAPGQQSRITVEASQIASSDFLHYFDGDEYLRGITSFAKANSTSPFALIYESQNRCHSGAFSVTVLGITEPQRESISRVPSKYISTPPTNCMTEPNEKEVGDMVYILGFMVIVVVVLMFLGFYLFLKQCLNCRKEPRYTDAVTIWENRYAPPRLNEDNFSDLSDQSDVQIPVIAEQGQLNPFQIFFKKYADFLGQSDSDEVLNPYEMGD